MTPLRHAIRDTRENLFTWQGNVVSQPVFFSLHFSLENITDSKRILQRMEAWFSNKLWRHVNFDKHKLVGWNDKSWSISMEYCRRIQTERIGSERVIRWHGTNELFNREGLLCFWQLRMLSSRGIENLGWNINSLFSLFLWIKLMTV